MPPATVVGARELKTRLGRYLNRVRLGDTIVVTDRSEPVAELRPIAAARDPAAAALAKLAATGGLTLPTRKTLVKRYVRERHSVKVRLAAAPIAISRLSEVEVPSALGASFASGVTPTVQGSGHHGVRHGHRSLARR